MFRKSDDAQKHKTENCHGGTGSFLCLSMLGNNESESFSIFHRDFIPPGVTVGEHIHTGSEEIYYLASGSCTLIYNGEQIPMNPGDLSIVKSGDSHGIINTGTTKAELIVIGAK